MRNREAEEMIREMIYSLTVAIILMAVVTVVFVAPVYAIVMTLTGTKYLTLVTQGYTLVAILAILLRGILR
jgi:hypothetical protein